MFALICLGLMLASFVLYATSPYWYESTEEQIGLAGMIVFGILTSVCSVYGV